MRLMKDIHRWRIIFMKTYVTQSFASEKKACEAYSLAWQRGRKDVRILEPGEGVDLKTQSIYIYYQDKPFKHSPAILGAGTEPFTHGCFCHRIEVPPLTKKVFVAVEVSSYEDPYDSTVNESFSILGHGLTYEEAYSACSSLLESNFWIQSVSI